MKKEEDFKRECEVCGKTITIYKERLYNSKWAKELFFSDEGVYFEDNQVWFCNHCFSEMTEGIDFNKIQKEVFK